MEIIKVEMEAIWISDYSPLIIDIRLEKVQRARRWRFNSQIFLQQKNRDELLRGVGHYFKDNRPSAEEDIMHAEKAVIGRCCKVIGRICIFKEIHFRKKISIKKEQKLKEIIELQRRLQKL